MIDSVFPSYRLQQLCRDDLLKAVSKDRTLAPRLGTDGLYRLQPISKKSLPASALSTFLPLKKELFPPGEKIWSYQAGQFHAIADHEPFTVIGLPLCDLQALWYLDQVFIDDAPYQAQRAQAFVVGLPCKEGSDCRCDRRLMPVAGDLFVSENRAWALSPAGAEKLEACGCHDEVEMPLPWPETRSKERPEITETQYQENTGASIWREEAKRCLSCGACSAVCPTCYCFDMLDEVALDGSVTRNRSWDNCFFAEHGKVAGGFDFRSGRENRLRFRLEHKLFGFGALHGQNSCVGCGRCRRVCPVDIDLDRIAAQLVEGDAP